MDPARGPRRVRHAPANVTAAAPRPTAAATSIPNARGNSISTSTPPGQGQTQHAPSPNQQPRVPQPQRQRHHITPETRESDDPRSEGSIPAVNPFRLHRAPRMTAHPRLSMPMDSDDDSGSEMDASILPLGRNTRPIPQRVPSEQQVNTADFEDEEMSQAEFEAEDTSVEEELEEEEEEEEEEVEEVEEVAPLADPSTLGLKEISNLSKFTVSSHKPGNGVDELRSDDLKQYWQSDGPQPHRLTIYFVKRVGIREIRFFVDYNEDESYTPTKIVFKSGTSENNLIEFATMTMDSPVGWQQVPIAGAGGDPDGNTLVSYVLQMQILENHQNGKDTHLRGIRIYAFDNESAVAHGTGRESNPVDEIVGLVDTANAESAADRSEEIEGGMARALAATGFTMPDFIRDPELR